MKWVHSLAKISSWPLKVPHSVKIKCRRSLWFEHCLLIKHTMYGFRRNSTTIEGLTYVNNILTAWRIPLNDSFQLLLGRFTIVLSFLAVYIFKMQLNPFANNSSIFLFPQGVFLPLHTSRAPFPRWKARRVEQKRTYVWLLNSGNSWVEVNTRVMQRSE